MLVTSLTTATAFFATATSRIFPLRQFGFFLAFLVVFNYILVRRSDQRRALSNLVRGLFRL